MSRFRRRFRGHQRKRFRGPKHVRPNRPHYRKALAPAPPKEAEVEVYQARNPGHSRIMGRIEYDVRTMLKVAEVPPEKTYLYLACAREMYSDVTASRPDAVEMALDATASRWIAREIEADMVERIRKKVRETYNSLKVQRLDARPAEAARPVMQES